MDPLQPTTTPDLFLIRFPPFPIVPSGVHIIPFKDFQEHGICLLAEPDKEVTDKHRGEHEIDTLGVRTVMIRKRHDTDIAKTEGRKKRQKRLEAERLQREEEERWEWDDGDIGANGTGWTGPGHAPTNRRRKMRVTTWYEDWEANEESKVMGPLNACVFHGSNFF